MMSANTVQQAIPAELQGDHTVKLVRREYRGEVQYQADYRIGGYWLVMDTSKRRLSLTEGETWIVTVERVVNKTAFCWLQRKVQNADGLHPVVSATKFYVERHCKVTITWHGNNRIEKLIAAVRVHGDDAEVIQLEFVDGSIYDLYHFGGKSGPYGRYSGDGYRKDNQRVHVTFWEN